MPVRLNLPTQPAPGTRGDVTLVDALCQSIKADIDGGVLRRGVKVPSIREQASARGVSRFTVVDAYERLVAMGLLESRRGSGFYVGTRAPLNLLAHRPRKATNVDSSWLSWHQFGNVVTRANMPGSALLPSDWLDADMIAASVRAVGRGSLQNMLHYGLPAGFAPLRQQLQLKLAQLEIQAAAAQIVTTSGITQALDIICRQIMRPGDAILVDDPGWYRMFNMFAALGLRVIGVPRLSDGPDIDKLDALARKHKPKILLVNSVLHNPTGSNLSAAKAHSILRVAEREDLLVVETDAFGDFHGGTVVRLANLDQLRRVIYLSTFSKTLSATLRVGFIACDAGLADSLVEQKMRSCLTTSELGERVVHHVLSEGHYRKHMARIRNRILAMRDPVIRKLEGIGLRIPLPPSHGLLVWADTGIDTNALALDGMANGYVLAPGSVFTPQQKASRWMRFNLTTTATPQFLAYLQSAMAGDVVSRGRGSAAKAV